MVWKRRRDSRLGHPRPGRRATWPNTPASVLDYHAVIPRLTFQSDSYHYNSPPFAVTEIDGARIVDTQSCDFIQLVPPSSDKVFRPGSTDPSAILFDALDLFEQHSAKADENINSVRPELAKAVDVLIEAAGQEIEPYWQRRLLHVS